MAFWRSIALMAMTGPAATQAQAEPQQFRTEYSVLAFGLPVARSVFETSIGEGRYALQGRLNAAGVAALFDSTKGTITAEGAYSRNAVTARSFDMRYTTGGKAKRTTVGFSRGAVSSSESVPAPKGESKPDWVPVTKAHLRDVLDPISAMVVPAKSLRAVCGRTLRVYDGEMRADIRLSYLRTIPFKTVGYDGEAVTCKGAFTPVAGYTAGKKEIRELAEKSRIEISFAPVGETGLYAPVAAKVSVSIGTVSLRASRFEALTR